MAARQWNLQAVCSQQSIIHNSKSEVNWKYVHTIHNPADLGSRGCYVERLTDEWWMGQAGWQIMKNGLKKKEIIPTRESEFLLDKRSHVCASRTRRRV